MVRETRHLWVGNLPENIREERIREHFKRYGRVQSVKLLPRLKEEDGSTGLCATVAFMDIKSASKAHNMEHKLDERCLSTEYYEPAAIPGGSAAPIYVPPRFPHGPPEDHATFERSSHFYERREGDAYLRRPASAYHVTDPLRGRTRDRLYRNGPYTPLIERTQPAHHRPLGNAWSYDGTTSGRYPTSTPTPDPYPEERRETQPVVHKKRPKSSRSGSESGSNSGSSRSRSRSRSRSHSSSSSSQSGSSSCSSGTSSPGTDKSCSPHSSSHHGTARSGRVGGVALQSAVSAPHANNVSPAVQSEDRRPLAICVRNLPIRSSDTSLKDGLFHEYKKHGKVTWVKVVGQAGDRYALVCFKKPDDVEKALEESHNKLFFGCKIEVAPYQGYDVEDNEFRPYEAELDEFHPKATRTLFIGNLEKDVTASELRKHFEQFGEIIEIDIKKQGVVSSYAFCQYADIASVVKAMRTMDGEHLGNNRIKLGFGKSMATNCVWVDGIADTVSEKYLNLQFSQFGSVTHINVDRERGHALIYFEQIPYAQDAVREMRGVLLRNRKLQVDFASRECQEAFYEHLEKQGLSVSGDRPWERYDSNNREVQAGRFETTVVVPGARFPRYESQQRPRATSYNRTSNCSTSTPVAAAVGTTVGQSRTTTRTQRAGQRYEYYDSEYPDRRYRNYDEFSQGSAASHDDSYEQELRDYGYCQRERGDSSPSPGACEGDSSSMRRSVAVVAARPAKSCSPGDKVPCSEDDPTYKRHSLQSVVVSSDVATPSQLPPPASATQHPLDIRHLQKERVHIQTLLEQLESSGDDDGGMSSAAPKKRMKLGSEDCGEPPPSIPMCAVGMDMCYENHGDVSAPSLVVTTHNHRKSVSEVRRLSDVSGKHCSRRLSTDSTSKHGGGGRDVRETSADRLVSVQPYSPHPVCKRRKTGSSTSESEDRVSCRSSKHSHHHHHHQHGEPATSMTISGGESVDGSRPGTPLCDERPENLLPPTEPRRFPRDRLNTEGPLSLPLPRFAAQVLSSTPRISVCKAAPVSSPPALHQPPPSPIPAPPPASPPPRPASLPSSTSSDSELSPPSPTLEERIRSLDEKYEKWSGSRALSAAGGDALAKLDASASERFRFRHKLLDLDLNELPPSDIVKSVLAKRSVFDEDSKRLENFSDKYEPREFVPYTRAVSSFHSLRIKTECMRELSCATPTKPVTPVASTPATGKVGAFPNPPPRLMGTPSPLHSPSHTLPKSPFSAGTPTTPTPLKSHLSLSPVGITPLHPPQQPQPVPKTPNTAAKGLQYPFPSHPPVLPTTTVATTTATTVSVTVPTSATGTVLSPEVARTCVAKPLTNPMRPSVTVLTTATGTKPTPEVVSRVPLKLAPVAAPLRVPTCAKPTVTTTSTAGTNTTVSSASTTRPSSASRVSTTVTTTTTVCSSKPLEQSPKSTECNIPPSEAPTSPRVVIVPVSVSTTTVTASSTATTTVLTMTLASTVATCTTFTTSVSTPTTKPKPCAVSKKEQPPAKDKPCETGKPKKEPVPPPAPAPAPAPSASTCKKDRPKTSSHVEEKSAECAERDRRKDSHSMEAKKDSVDSTDKERRKEECTDNLDRRKEVVDSSDKDRWKEGLLETVDKERWKEETQDKERRKENHMPEKEAEPAPDVEKRVENIEKRSKERRKERGSSSGSPASIGCKRRMSSQDSLDSVPDDAKRLKLEHRKIAERRDSKDSGRSSGSSKRSSSERPRSHGSANANGTPGADTKTFAKLLEDKIREDNKRQDTDRKKEIKTPESCDKHKTKDKQKKKNKSDRDSPKEMRDLSSKPIKEQQPLEKELSPKAAKKKEDSDAEEEGKHKHVKREVKEKKKQVKDEFGSSEFLDEKGRVTKKDRDKRNSIERRKEESVGKEDQKFISQKKEGKPQKKDYSNSDTDSEDGSGDGPKKHSIFDIVDDGPAYISMYDKVKARSTKNMQKQEEERRQEMMREKFDLLKKKRAKREEKKRSTSWDEDSDSDNDHGSKLKRHVKLMISSSSEDERHSRYDGDEAKLNKIRPVVRIKKEDICTGKSDSDSDVLARRPAGVIGKLEGSEDDDSLARTKLLPCGKKGIRSKLVSDTSEDDNTMNRFKSNAYSADSDADQGFADSDDKLPTSKKSTKNNRMDSSNDESSKKLISDITKPATDKPKKVANKNKFNKSLVDSSDEEYSRKFLCDVGKSDVYSDDKQASLKKSFVKNRTPKDSLDSSDDESSRKTDVLNLKKSSAKNKSKIPVDSSDDENMRKLSNLPKCDVFGEDKQALFRKSLLKNKTSKSFPDISSEDTTKKFLSDTEKTDDSIQADKSGSVQSKSTVAHSNSSDCEATPSSPPPQLEKKASFHGNSLEKSGDVPRKKSHKKKQKRQKNSQSSEDSLVKVVSDAQEKPEGEEGKLKADGERKRHKRERRKSTHGKSLDGDDGKQTKVKKKKIPKPELGVLKPESSLKRDEKMEDIFGPLSDDSESGHVKTSIASNNGGAGRMYEKLPGKWQVSLVYGSDSDSNASLHVPRMDCFTPAAAIVSRASEKERRRREKKKRDKKASNVELVEAGRALEAKLLSSDDYPEPTLTAGKTEKPDDIAPKEESGNNDTDVFRFTDGDESLEAATAMLLEKAKEKKKKRKKSKEEKQSRREHHHHHHHDKSKSSPERKLSVEDSKPSPLMSPSLPSLDMPLSPPVDKAPPDDVPTKSNEKKKPDKFIPGFGAAIDDMIHETAVKSISEFEAPKPKVEHLVKEEASNKVEQGLPKNEDGSEEEKPRAVISQEETEDAVAALLGESFGGDFNPSDCYVGEGNGSPHATATPALPTDEEEETRKAIEAIDMKPDTPQSEPDLQIDTDTDGDPEPNYPGDHSPRTPDGIDFSRPPKTPDLPSSYYRQDSKPESSPSITKQVSPQVMKPEEEAPPSSSPLSPPEKSVPNEEPKSEPEVSKPDTESVSSDQREQVIPKICVTDENNETKEEVDVPEPPSIPYEPKEEVEDKADVSVDPEPQKPKVESDPPAETAGTETEPETETETLAVSEIKEEVCEESPKVETEPQPLSVDVSSPCPTPTLPKCSPVPPPVDSEVPVETKDVTAKDPETPQKEEAKPEEDRSYQFDKEPAKECESDRNYISSTKEDSGFVSVIKEEHASDIARESDFSEPETDMKADDFVTNLLASDSMTQALDDNSRSEMDTGGRYSPFKEREVEVVSVIKESDHRFKDEVEEQDPFASPLSKDTFEGLSLHKDLDSRSDLSNVIKADSDFWSAKEVNIESVIKKVDALCSGDEDSETVNDNGNKLWFEKTLDTPVVDIKKEPEPVDNTCTKVEEPEQAKVADKDEISLSEEQEQKTLDTSPVKDVDSSAPLSTSPDEKDDILLSASSPEGEVVTTPRSSSRGGRGGLRGKTQARMSGVTTRRTRLAGGQKPVTESITIAPVSPRRGGRRNRGSCNKASPQEHTLAATNKKLPTDVYEFRDDSEDESSNNGEKGRPRLILTIKSPQAAVAAAVSASKEVQVATKTTPAPVPVVETREEFPSPVTRKSRRLQERDGSRSTVDDVIEDVVRSAGKNTRAAAAAAALAAARPRRSTRQNLASQRLPIVIPPEQPRKSPRGGKGKQMQPSNDESGDDKKKQTDEEQPQSPEADKEVEKLPESPEPSVKPPEPEKEPEAPKPEVEEEDAEPTTLIDPVTGLLIPMRESEEGQYIPVTTAQVIVPTRSLSECEELPRAAEEPRARAQSLPSIPAVTTESAPPQSHVPVIAKPVVTPLSVCKPKTTVPPTLKSHVLQQTPKTVQTTATTVTTTTTTTTKVVLPAPPPPVAHPKVILQSTVPLNPKAHLLQAVANKPVVIAGPLPVVSKLHHVQQQPVNMKTSSPKGHLLQAAGPPKGAPSFVPQAKCVGSGKVPVSSPPKAQQPILTGAVASPPLKAPHISSQQPIVTGASSSRAAVPKSQMPGLPGTHLSQHGKGLMDPPKVDVSLGGCIVVPTASPQPRGQVLQAQLPVPAFEASLGEVQHVSFPHHMRNPPHDLAQHYVHPQLMYHQYLRAHHDVLTAHIPHYLPQGAVRSPMVPGMEVKSEPESDEARGSSPPLELRRPSSNGAVARGGGPVAHSLQSPHDRTTDSPQVATVYVHAASRLPHYTPPQQPPPRYYEPGAEPPPAHLRTPRHHHPLPGTEAPATQPHLQVATPPHASQVPPQADSLLMLLQRYPVMWQGLLALKNDQAAVQMHFVFGNPHVARESLPCNSDGSTPPLRIAQRMRLEQTQVEGVARKMQIDNEHCMLLALPCGRDHMDVLQQSNNLQTGFITYLQQKQAAGIVNIAAPGSQQAAYVVHIFPSCDFANENLARIAPDLLHRVADIAHLLIIIATV